MAMFLSGCSLSSSGISWRDPSILTVLHFTTCQKGESDSIVFIYDSTKMDQSGDFVQQKNCYSNPLPGREHCCLWLSLACWFAINQEKLTESEFFFVAAGSELKTASQNYTRQVSEMAKRYEDQVRAEPTSV
jgi:hypothetical protein